MESLKTTALTDVHRSMGAKMVPFAGFNMPVLYTNLIEEHVCVRNAVGVFDVSHMGQLYLSGAGLDAAVEALLPIDLSTNDELALQGLE